MIINVTQEHINAGIVRNCHKCPVALAIKETMGDVNVSAYNDSVWIDDNNYNLPKNAINFIKWFDWNILLQPFSFELNTTKLWEKNHD